MGRLNSAQEQLATLKWGIAFSHKKSDVRRVNSLLQIQEAFDVELKQYFALACLARSLTADQEMVNEATRVIFSVRVVLERTIEASIEYAIGSHTDELLFGGSIFGRSNKQGTSFRMPLISCVPTRLCASACYAHDVLDAAPAAIIRGVINGILASKYEKLAEAFRNTMLMRLVPHVNRAIHTAHSEVASLNGTEWMRRPHIRFSHIGEIAAFPTFANDIAGLVHKESQGDVDCVVYTRHPKVGELNPDLWVINFTLDKSCPERQAWVPSHARRVFSAFGGEVDKTVDVNFLEHHRWKHMPPIGEGHICPATLPETTVRSCDAVRCNLCFERPNLRC